MSDYETTVPPPPEPRAPAARAPESPPVEPRQPPPADLSTGAPPDTFGQQIAVKGGLPADLENRLETIVKRRTNRADDAEAPG
jgi:hypothetical protein